MVSWAEHEREHKIEAMHERNARLAAYREVLEMVQELYNQLSIGKTAHQFMTLRLNAMIAKEEAK